jgi:hypothetical protein
VAEPDASSRATAIVGAVAPELVQVDAGAVKYLGVLCMVLVTNKPVSPYYTLNIADERVPFTAVIGMSNVVPREQTAAT